MPRTDPQSQSELDPEKVSSRPPGRLRSALQVLRGQALVPDQIVWEWMEYQQRFNDLLTRFSALLARQAKSEKRRAEKALEEPSHRQPASPSSKAELRAMYGPLVARRHVGPRVVPPLQPPSQGALALNPEPEEDP